MKRNNNTKILVDNGVKRLLAKQFNVSAPTVRVALSADWSTYLHALIRKAAIKEYKGIAIKL